MASPFLSIRVAGSSFRAPFDDTRFETYRALLNNADAITLHQNGRRIQVELEGMKRWIAFSEEVSGSVLYAVGYQETVGAIQRDGMYTGGSNRQVLCWVWPNGDMRLVCAS